MNLKEKILFGAIIVVITGAINISILFVVGKSVGVAKRTDLSTLVGATDSIFTALYYLEKGTGPLIPDTDIRVRIDDELEIAREYLKENGLREMRMEKLQDN
ncbi:MAG: hypothetical protein E2O68_01465 [Deltaproteobacteria bacterium]|nr:MAG: hypothetical protein E2O68_01465 [Deltaproteobacteria bacterium]